MFYGKIKYPDTANGTGIRLSLFVSGCTNQCKGCFQPETWAFDYGKPYTQDVENDIISTIQLPYYDGITILGGEPFEICNQIEIRNLVKRIKQETNKNIWIFTGFIYDLDLVPGGKRYCEHTDEILDNIDVLVDGPFVEGQKNISLKFRGSENQRLINMKESRKQKQVVTLNN